MLKVPTLWSLKGVVREGAPRTLTVELTQWPTAPTAATQPAGCDPCACSTYLSIQSLRLSNFNPHGGARGTPSSLIWLGIQRHSNLSPAGGASLVRLRKKT